MNQKLHDPRNAPLNYETQAHRVPVAVPVWLCVTLIVCGTALVLVPAWSIGMRFDILFRSVVNLAICGLMLLLGTGMIVLGYWHARH